MISSFIEILPFRSWIKYKDKPLTGRRPEWLFATKGIDPRQLHVLHVPVQTHSTTS